MSDVIDQINAELKILEEHGLHNRTGEVRKVAKKVYKKLGKTSFDDRLSVCEEILKMRTWASWIIAFDIAYREKAHYAMDTFAVFEHWLIEYVRDWEDCDDFCTHALGALVLKHKNLYKDIVKWCDSPEFWVRRAAPVSMIYSIRRNDVSGLDIFELADRLMNDEHYLVLKGYGWMLKEYSKNQPQLVIDYLRKNAKDMPRVSFRYALENMDKDVKAELMKL